MITLGDISILKTIDEWRIKKRLDLNFITYLKKNNIDTVDKLNKIRNYTIIEGLLKKEMHEFLESSTDKINVWNHEEPTQKETLNLSEIETNGLEHNFRGNVLPVSYKNADAIWGNWQADELYKVIHGSTTYHLNRQRSYKFHPFTYEFRGVIENDISRIHQGIIMFYNQISSLTELYPELPFVPDLFFYSQTYKMKKVEETLPDILEYYDQNEKLVFGNLTDVSKKEILTEENGLLRQSFIKLLANYMTPEETESIHIKTLDKFKIRQ